MTHVDLVLVQFTLNMENLPANFPEVLTKERETVDAWKQSGTIEHLFLRPTKDGAVILFAHADEDFVRTLVEQLPLFPFIKSVTYQPVLKQF